MEDKDNEKHTSQDENNTTGSGGSGGSGGNAQVPSSLLPTVLHRLGLPPEQAQSEVSVDDLLANLKSDDWEVRVAAVRALGKPGTRVPRELLTSALHDEDASVRAAAVHVLADAGEQAPLGQLVAALRDSDWHVRETAVLALAKRHHVPNEVLITALYDTDASVREATVLALQWNSPSGVLDKSRTYHEETTSVSYGRLWEQKTMQSDKYNTSLANDKESSTSFQTMPHDAWNGTSQYSSNAASSHGRSEQVQEYEPQMSPSYEYGASSYGEKLIPRPRRSQRGWWAAIALVAILSFLLGGLAFWMMPVPIKAPTSVAPVHMEQQNVDVPPFQNPKYSIIVQDSMAGSLHLAPQQISAQLKEGKSMTDIAAAQGVSADQLRTIELQAFQDAFNQGVKSGDLDPKYAGYWMQQFQNDPQLLNKMALIQWMR